MKRLIIALMLAATLTGCPGMPTPDWMTPDWARPGSSYKYQYPEDYNLMKDCAADGGEVRYYEGAYHCKFDKKQ